MSQPRPSRGAYVAFGALWFMRLGILGMLAVILAVLWQRYHLSDDQQELARYVEVEVPVLLRAEQPVLQRVAELLDGDFQPNEPLRRALQDDLMPQLIRLRKAAQAPRTAAKTRAVIVVEHDMEFVRRLDCKVTVLHEGSVLAEGTLDHVTSNQQVIDVYLGR